MHLRLASWHQGTNFQPGAAGKTKRQHLIHLQVSGNFYVLTTVNMLNVIAGNAQVSKRPENMSEIAYSWPRPGWTGGF